MTTVIKIYADEIAKSDQAMFDDEGEPIFALMITGKDRYHASLARNSIVSFLKQSYVNRFLLVINDGDYSFDCTGIPRNRVVQIPFEQPPTASRAKLGQLRNASLDLVPKGAVWVQWDDDDWHHPDLMAQQFEVLCSHNVQACFLRSQVKYAFSLKTGWADYFPGGFAGTLMARNLDELRYENVSSGEDSILCQALKQSYKWIAWNNPAHYYLRFIHGHNTWPDSHFQLDRREPNVLSMPSSSADYLRSVLPLYEANSED